GEGGGVDGVARGRPLEILPAAGADDQGAVVEPQPLDGGQGVGPVRAADRGRAARGGHGVVRDGAGEDRRVDARAAAQRVVGAAAGDDVVAIPAVDVVEAGRADEVVRARRAV